MPQTHDLGRVFVHGLKYPQIDPPLVELGRSQMIEEPFRKGRSISIRLPWTNYALVLGVWGRQQSELDALNWVLSSYEAPIETLREWRRPGKDKVRSSGREDGHNGLG